MASQYATSDATGMAYCQNPLDPNHEHRTDAEWLTAQLRSSDAKFALYSKLDPLMRTRDSEGKRLKPPQAMYVSAADAPDALSALAQREGGVDCDSEGNPLVVYLGSAAGGEPYFAVDASDLEGKDALVSNEVDFGNFYIGSLFMDLQDSAILGQGRQVLAWHRDYKFCPKCGNALTPSHGGYKRACRTDACSKNELYPRTDPCVIMHIVHPDGEHALLGRTKLFPPNFYSCLAGYIDPCETLESAVRREVHEETAVSVGRVQYVASSPFPFPNSLMIGFIGEATDPALTVNTDELEDAKWVSRADICNALEAATDKSVESELKLPPAALIANYLLSEWAEGRLQLSAPSKL